MQFGKAGECAGLLCGDIDVVATSTQRRLGHRGCSVLKRPYAVDDQPAAHEGLLQCAGVIQLRHATHNGRRKQRVKPLGVAPDSHHVHAT
ncbi:hypothetical protein D3C72_2090290 [compost metagenome]